MNFTQLIVPLLVLMIPAFGQMRENTDPQLSCGSLFSRSCPKAGIIKTNSGTIRWVKFMDTLLIWLT